jgi:hypothetical protein
MTTETKKRLWLCLSPFTFCLLDQGFTLWNQSTEYWSGNYKVALEGNPLIQRLLSQHLIVYEAGFIGWLILFLFLIISLPKRLALVLSIGITFGHMWGVVSWIMYTAFYGYWICLVLILVASLLIVVGWEKYISASE